nr:Druantia anti-phage system protein DruA [Accumulibacter sp.]
MAADSRRLSRWRRAGHRSRVWVDWIKVGQTTGRGKKCPTSKPILPIKDIWLYPLHRNFRSILCR